MKDDRRLAKNQHPSAGMKIVFSEKAFVVVIYAILIGLGYSHSQPDSVPPKPIEQFRSLESK